jgi:hypothetical protein
VKINNEFLKMMKKNVCLFMLFLALGTAGVSVFAQVTIGSDVAPHPGAVLDLKSTSKGVLLPTVTLSNNVADFQLQGDKSKAVGLIAYNNGDTPGLYVWDGTSWNRINSCSLPAAPTAVSFSPAITGNMGCHLADGFELAQSDASDFGNIF